MTSLVLHEAVAVGTEDRAAVDLYTVADRDILQNRGIVFSSLASEPQTPRENGATHLDRLYRTPKNPLGVRPRIHTGVGAQRGRDSRPVRLANFGSA